MELEQILTLSGITLFTLFFILVICWVKTAVEAKFRKNVYYIKQSKVILKKTVDEEKFLCKKVLFESTNRHERSIIASSLKQTLDEEIERLQHISDSIKLVQHLPNFTPTLNTSFMSDVDTSGLSFGNQLNAFVNQGNIVDVNLKEGNKRESKKDSKQTLHSKICKTWGAHTVKRLRSNGDKKRTSRINRWQYLPFKNAIKHQFIRRQCFECYTLKHIDNLKYLEKCKQLKNLNGKDLSTKASGTYIDSMNKQSELFYQLPDTSDVGLEQIKLKLTFKSKLFSFSSDLLRQYTNKMLNNKSFVRKTLMKPIKMYKRANYRLKYNQGFKTTNFKINQIHTNKDVDSRFKSNHIFRVPILINKTKVILKFIIHFLIKSHKGHSHSSYTAGELTQLQPITKNYISDNVKRQLKDSFNNRGNHHRRHSLCTITSPSQFEFCKTYDNLDHHVSLSLSSVERHKTLKLDDTKRIPLKYYSDNYSEVEFEETVIKPIRLAKGCFIDSSDLIYGHFSQFMDHVTSDKTKLSITEEDLVEDICEHSDQTNEDLFKHLDVEKLVCKRICPLNEECGLIEENKQEPLLPLGNNRIIMFDSKDFKNKLDYNLNQDERSQMIEETTSILVLDVKTSLCNLGKVLFGQKTFTSIFEFKSFYQGHFDRPSPGSASTVVININKGRLSEIEVVNNVAHLRKMCFNNENFSCVDNIDSIKYINGTIVSCNNAVCSIKVGKGSLCERIITGEHIPIDEVVKFLLCLEKQTDDEAQHLSSAMITMKSALLHSATDYFKDDFFIESELPDQSNSQIELTDIEERNNDGNSSTF